MWGAVSALSWAPSELSLQTWIFPPRFSPTRNCFESPRLFSHLLLKSSHWNQSSPPFLQVYSGHVTFLLGFSAFHPYLLEILPDNLKQMVISNNVKRYTIPSYLLKDFPRTLAQARYTVDVTPFHSFPLWYLFPPHFLFLGVFVGSFHFQDFFAIGVMPVYFHLLTDFLRYAHEIHQ